ncbi:MAG: long-chain fatty acid--CoA ligase [Chloroflexi bacterium]|nr:long-chain fatty acid--CoA ligase [Chloroflexota bacterium]MBI3732073.1 long-chain fatty acid--CoA ligase [Chloroflexota bacterium]
MNIAQHVERAAKLFPNKPALIFEGAQLQYGDLNTRANRLANALKANGVERGDRVAIYLPNIPQFAVCYLAVLKAGAVAVSVNAILKSEEVAYIVNDSGAVALFTVSDLLPNVRRDDCPSLRQVVVCAGDPHGQIALDDWLSKGASEGKAADLRPTDPALLLYTSGTTGFPKGATLTHGNVVSNLYATVHHAGYKPDDRLALFLPLFHVFGQNFIMNAAFTACATLVLYRRFVPDAVLDSIRRERVTMFFAVPTIYINLLNMDLSKYDLSSIRYEFSAAATMPQEISRRWTERFGRPVYEGYGLTECSPFACYNHDFRHKFGSVGTAVENFELKILDEQDNELPLGQWGEIGIKGPGVMQGYWGKPEDTARALRGGWLHSGDIGTMDDEGYVFIVDRVKDMINVSGFKVWPAEVEQVLYRHPAVKELAIYGAPDPLKGEAVRAAVVLKDGAAATSEELIAFCRERIAVYKAPEAVEFVKELPKSATGKILKRVLRGQ